MYLSFIECETINLHELCCVLVNVINLLFFVNVINLLFTGTEIYFRSVYVVLNL